MNPRCNSNFHKCMEIKKQKAQFQYQAQHQNKLVEFCTYTVATKVCRKTYSKNQIKKKEIK